MNRERVGRHEARPRLIADRETVRQQTAEYVATLYTGRHRP
jgi:hypothetical protein